MTVSLSASAKNLPKPLNLLERLRNIAAELEEAIGNEDWQQARRLVIQLRYWESFQRAGKGMEVDH